MTKMSLSFFFLFPFPSPLSRLSSLSFSLVFRKTHSNIQTFAQPRSITDRSRLQHENIFPIISSTQGINRRSKRRRNAKETYDLPTLDHRLPVPGSWFWGQIWDHRDEDTWNGHIMRLERSLPEKSPENFIHRHPPPSKLLFTDNPPPKMKKFFSDK